MRTSSLFLSRDTFKSNSSIVDSNENSIIYEEEKEQQGESRKPSVRLRSKTARCNENLRKKSFMNRHSVSLPVRYKFDEHGYIDRIRKISSIENPFTFGEDPILVQQRLQTLGTSDLKVCKIQFCLFLFFTFHCLYIT